MKIADKADLDNFNFAAALAMRNRLDHGARKFGALSWRTGTYTDSDNAERLQRAVDHLIAARGNTDDPSEWTKRAADVANQAFMLADPKRVSGPNPVTGREGAGGTADADVRTVMEHSSPYRNCVYAGGFRAPCPEVDPGVPESWCAFCQAHARLTARLAEPSS